MLVPSQFTKSSSHAIDFGIAAGTAMWIERAADDLRLVLSNYVVLHSDGTLLLGAYNRV